MLIGKNYFLNFYFCGETYSGYNDESCPGINLSACDVINFVRFNFLEIGEIFVKMISATNSGTLRTLKYKKVDVCVQIVKKIWKTRKSFNLTAQNYRGDRRNARIS